ncbi:uncharacterized protein [Diabrotica undecimpunctata]|uniref:uncharacterized protein n=1 Tax=Diabrotica undecimpunctata TaxID=50387 RepID=UPI003B632EC4
MKKKLRKIYRKEITEYKNESFQSSSVLTFENESWVLTKRQTSNTQAIEMKFLRRVKGVTKMDRIRNVDIRNELKMQSTLEFIEQRQLSWWSHLHRMQDIVPVRRVWEVKILKNKKRGRPRQTWDKVIGNMLERRGVT